MSDDAPSLADRMAAARAAWQHDVRISRGPAPAEAPAHVPQLISLFRAFEVFQCAEFKSQDAGTRNEVVRLADIQSQFSHSQSASINEVRQNPRYVADFWTLYGQKEDGTAQAIGDFKTEDMARDVLGGITGDRNYDQRHLIDTELRAEHIERMFQGGYGGVGNSTGHAEGLTPLADRMRADWNSERASNFHEAAKQAEFEAHSEAVAKVHRDHPIKAAVLGDDWIYGQVPHETPERPSDQLLGSTHRMKW